MPDISFRGRLMPESPIRKLFPLAEKATREGKKVYHLNIGQPDIPTSPTALEAIKNFNQPVIEYSHSAGSEATRRKLCEYYSRHDICIEPRDIFITAGGSEALLLGLLACLNTDDEIIVPEPFYANYYSFSIAAGSKIVPITSKIENGFALPPISEFEKAITSRTKAIIICNPNNPTGYLYSEEELNQLATIVKKYDLFLFSDEVYREFVYDGYRHFSVMNLKGIENNVILVDSISKRYSACGLRIGAFITKNREVLTAAIKFGMARLSPPAIGQIAAAGAIDSPPEYMENVYNEYLARRNFLIAALNKIPGVYVPMPRGAFYCIAKLPVDDADKFAAWMLGDFAWDNQTLMVAPASGFYSKEGLGRQEVRLAYVLNVEKLSKAVTVLQKALEAYPGRTSV